MPNVSKPIACVALMLVLSSASVLAQSAGGAAGGGAGGGSAGTNSAGTANSSGGAMTTGAGAGGAPSPDGKPTTGDPRVDAQDRAVDRKVKSICKGC